MQENPISHRKKTELYIEYQKVIINEREVPDQCFTNYNLSKLIFLTR